ncbi:hypothetical protein OIDMADRAFT_35296 [Oidiodendron maius Zn]|uniref:beta-galactosidase n=1 Tax=Oidiodendron maius (strain Zn) TaxID=913774 RepID=A0A0C3CVT9_OIDMZ|nr:hypothetical protein OIDMADRAFT_35296 [Oidiodendron maius Zn]
MTGIFPPSKPDWSNIDIIHRGVLPARSYFFLYSNEADALTADLDLSCSIKLSGTWKFYHSSSPFEVPSGFEDPSFDTSQWGDIRVPGHWQLQGYGKPHYSNVNFIMPVDSPNVPFDSNQTGTYIRKFTVPKDFVDQQLRLRFEGVDSAFHVHINGIEILRI